MAEQQAPEVSVRWLQVAVGERQALEVGGEAAAGSGAEKRP